MYTIIKYDNETVFRVTLLGGERRVIRSLELAIEAIDTDWEKVNNPKM